MDRSFSILSQFTCLTDGQTAFSQLVRASIPCSAEKQFLWLMCNAWI